VRLKALYLWLSLGRSAHHMLSKSSRHHKKYKSFVCRLILTYTWLITNFSSETRHCLQMNWPMNIFADVLTLKSGKRCLLPSPSSLIQISSVRRKFTLPDHTQTGRTILLNAASLTGQGLAAVNKYYCKRVSLQIEHSWNWLEQSSFLVRNMVSIENRFG